MVRLVRPVKGLRRALVNPRQIGTDGRVCTQAGAQCDEDLQHEGWLKIHRDTPVSFSRVRSAPSPSIPSSTCMVIVVSITGKAPP